MPYMPDAVMGEDGFLVLNTRKNPSLAGAPHPFPYQGSKRALAHNIMEFIPPDAERLIEPFAGSAAVSIAARHLKKVATSVIGDVNEPLMGLWESILLRPDALAAQYEEMWHGGLADPKAQFLGLRDDFNRTKDPAILLYLLNRIVKGAVRYKRSGEFNQSADNRRLGAKPDLVRRRIAETSRVMHGTTVRSASYEALLSDATPLDVVYMDPPYQGVSNVRDHRYMAGLLREDFEQELDSANRRGVAFIISYDSVREDGKYGKALDEGLDLLHLHIVAGRSAQSTLSGGDDVTVESIYLSPALVKRLPTETSSLF